MVGQSRILILLLVVIGMAACSGDNTGVEVIPEPGIEITPEPIEEVIPEEEPELDFGYFPTLESWGAEDGFINVATDNEGNCVDSLLNDDRDYKYIFSGMEKITTATSTVWGPECRDDDNEGSLIKVACVSETNFGGFFVYCLDGHPDYVGETPVPELCDAIAEEQDGECVLTYYDSNNPQSLHIVDSGRTNFYDNLFKRSIYYINTRGEVEVYIYGRRSFIMVRTHIEYSGYQEVSAVAGRLYGNYNPNSAEYKDRKRLWNECGVGTDPQIGSEREDEREIGINGKWREEDGVVCVILDTLPGADLEENCVSKNKICELFDEG